MGSALQTLKTESIQKENQYPITKPLELSDLEILTLYAEKHHSFSCEFNFTNLFLWDEIYDYQLSFFNSWLIIIDSASDYALMPLGDDINPAGLVKLSSMLRESGYSGDIGNIPPEFIDAYPELSLHYEIENIRDEAEYIYSAQKLSTLAGKKLRKKRNHISQFIRQYPDYQVKTMSLAVRSDCLNMARNIVAESQPESQNLKKEMKALSRAFEYFERLPLEGIAIYTGENDIKQLICFALYSRLNSNTVTIHFEKADFNYKGSAQIINQETAKQLDGRYEYINREQDLGVEGLRKAKLSYDPEFLYPAIFLSFIQ